MVSERFSMVRCWEATKASNAETVGAGGDIGVVDNVIVNVGISTA